jgi:hypothetical protein
MDHQFVTKVKAVQWTGNNLDEMKLLLEDVVESNELDGPEVYTSYIEPYFLRTGSGEGYYILQFYAGDDMEADPGQWVVVYDDLEVEIMDDELFCTLKGLTS